MMTVAMTCAQWLLALAIPVSAQTIPNGAPDLLIKLNRETREVQMAILPPGASVIQSKEAIEAIPTTVVGRVDANGNGTFEISTANDAGSGVAADDVTAANSWWYRFRAGCVGWVCGGAIRWGGGGYYGGWYGYGAGWGWGGWGWNVGWGWNTWLYGARWGVVAY